MVVKHSYYYNRKRMLLEKQVYMKVNDLGINWEEIQKEKQRLMSVGHAPPVSDNLAARFVIDKASNEVMKKGLSAVKATRNEDFFALNMKSNKKGFIGDNIAIGISLMIIIAMVVLLATYMSSQNDNIQSSSSDTVFKSTFNSSLGGMSSAMDKGLVVGIVILVTFLLYSAYMISSNFGLFMIALLANMISLFLLPIMEDFLVASYYNNSYATATAAMPATFYIINNYTIFCTGVFTLMLIALYLRSDGQ